MSARPQHFGAILGQLGKFGVQALLERLGAAFGQAPTQRSSGFWREPPGEIFAATGPG